MFRFQHPEYLFCVLLLPILAYFFYTYRAWMLDIVAKLGGKEGMSRFFSGFDEKKLLPRFTLLLLGLAFLVLGIANPQTLGDEQQTKQDGTPLVLVLDISESMLAEDIAPNRLERARAFFQELLEQAHGNPIGLILFAGTSDLAAPVSNDYKYTENALAFANPDQAGAQGTSIAAALRAATNALGDKAGLAVLVTDGEDHEAGVEEAAKALKNSGIYLLSFGIGSANGAPIPQQNGYKKDADGATVHSKLNQEMIQEISKAAEGSAVFLTNNQEAVQLVLEKLSQIEKGEIQITNTKAYQSWFQWLLFPAFFLFFLEWLLQLKKKRTLM